MLKVGFTVKDGFSTSILLQKLTTTPIKSLEFTGDYVASGVQLNWTSTEEVNVKKFLLYRSYDGLSFDEIASTNAKGSISAKAIYNHRDIGFSNKIETVYYKLQSIDIDGSVSAEKVITVKLPFTNTGILYFPNPVASILNVSIEANLATELDIRIFSLTGKMVWRQKRLVKKGENRIEINLVNLNTGEYIIKLSGNDISNASKFLKL